MEHIAGILTALQNNWFALTVLLVLIGLITYGVRKGVVSFNGHGLKVGQDAAAIESKIRNMQQVYAKALLGSTVADLPAECEKYHKLYVISECLDEVERMIRENHITSDETYIDTEYQIIYNIVLKETSIDFFRSQEFKDYLYDLITKLVKQLEKIRKTYVIGSN